MKGLKMKCPKCNSENTIKRGKRRSCNDCGAWYTVLKETSHTFKMDKKGHAECSSEGKIRTLEELLSVCEVDLNKWEVSKHWIKYIGNDNYRLTATLVPKKQKINLEDFKNDIKELVKYSPNPPRLKYKKQKKACALEINIFDLHFGKLGWHEEVGADYDSKIARTRFFTAIEDLIKKALTLSEIDSIIFPVGNDFFNYDKAYPFPQTTGGTPQESDLRWQKMYREGCKIIIDAVDRLKKIAPMNIVVVQGNHSFQVDTYLGYLLEVYYSKDDNVFVNNSPKTRKYHQYHNMLLGFTHGNSRDETEKRLLQMMPQESPELWAKTKYREWHLGDIHHKKVFKLKSEEDFCGIVLRYMRSLSGTDAWHNKKGFIGATMGAEAYVIDKEDGIIGIFNYNIKT